MTTWKQYQKIYSFRYGMALMKVVQNFLTEAHLSSFQILSSFHGVPFYTGQTTYMFHLFFIRAALDEREEWLAGPYSYRVCSYQFFQLTSQFSRWTLVHDIAGELNSKAHKECIVTLEYVFSIWGSGN